MNRLMFVLHSSGFTLVCMKDLKVSALLYIVFYSINFLLLAEISLIKFLQFNKTQR